MYSTFTGADSQDAQTKLPGLEGNTLRYQSASLADDIIYIRITKTGGDSIFPHLMPSNFGISDVDVFVTDIEKQLQDIQNFISTIGTGNGGFD